VEPVELLGLPSVVAVVGDELAVVGEAPVVVPVVAVPAAVVGLVAPVADVGLVAPEAVVAAVVATVVALLVLSSSSSPQAARIGITSAMSISRPA